MKRRQFIAGRWPVVARAASGANAAACWPTRLIRAPTLVARADEVIE